MILFTFSLSSRCCANTLVRFRRVKHSVKAQKTSWFVLKKTCLYDHRLRRADFLWKIAGFWLAHKQLEVSAGTLFKEETPAFDATKNVRRCCQVSLAALLADPLRCQKKKEALSCFNPVLLLLQLPVICMSASATSYMGIISCDLHLFTVKYLTGVGCDRLPGHRSFGLTSSYLPVMRYSRLLLENDQDPTSSNSII